MKTRYHGSPWICVLLFLALLQGPADAGRSSLKRVKEEVTAANFLLKDLSGKPVRFSDFRGKAVLLNFWATWCQTCVTERTALERLWQAYRPRGLVVLAVSIDRSSPVKVREFVESRGLSFPVLHDRDDLIGPQYSVLGVPTSFLITPAGRITYRVAGPYDWGGTEARKVIEQLLGDQGR